VCNLRAKQLDKKTYPFYTKMKAIIIMFLGTRLQDLAFSGRTFRDNYFYLALE